MRGTQAPVGKYILKSKKKKTIIKLCSDEIGDCNL